MLKFQENLNKQKGQVMLLTVVVLSGTLLVVSGVVGFLMLHKIKQSTNIVDSTKSILAADSGIEWELFRYFKTDKYGKCILLSCPADYSWATSGDAGCPASILSQCSGGDFVCLSNCGYTTTTVVIDSSIKSIGKAGNTTRAFQMLLK